MKCEYCLKAEATIHNVVFDLTAGARVVERSWQLCPACAQASMSPEEFKKVPKAGKMGATPGSIAGYGPDASNDGASSTDGSPALRRRRGRQ